MMTLNFHGVRGSHPVADVQMVKFGGNTSCVEIVKTNLQGVKVPIIIDSGSGIIKFGYSLMQKIFSGEYSKTFPLFFTHMHPDHTEGFNFFLPVFFDFCTIHIMGMETMNENLEHMLKMRTTPPVFPIEYKDLKFRKFHHVLSDGNVFFIDQNGAPWLNSPTPPEKPLFEVRVMQAWAPSHPQQGAMYYRITDPDDGSSIACIWDLESHTGGDIRAINFSKNASVMIHDTQYTDEEYLSVKVPVQGFGHSTYSMAMENTEKAGVKNLITFHYNPRHSDHFLRKNARRYTRRKTAFDFHLSYEGFSLTLDQGKIVKNEDIKLGFAK